MKPGPAAIQEGFKVDIFSYTAIKNSGNLNLQEKSGQGIPVKTCTKKETLLAKIFSGTFSRK